MKLVLTLLCPQVQEGSVSSPPGPHYSDPCIAAICLQIINFRRMGSLMKREKGRGGEGEEGRGGERKTQERRGCNPRVSV